MTQFKASQEQNSSWNKGAGICIFAYQRPVSSAVKIIGLQSNPTPINTRSETKRTWKLKSSLNIMKLRGQHMQLNTSRRENADPHHGEADHAVPNFVQQETFQYHQWNISWNCALEIKHQTVLCMRGAVVKSNIYIPLKHNVDLMNSQGQESSIGARTCIGQCLSTWWPPYTKCPGRW
jgi:hypothetical protein